MTISHLTTKHVMFGGRGYKPRQHNIGGNNQLVLLITSIKDEAITHIANAAMTTYKYKIIRCRVPQELSVLREHHNLQMSVFIREGDTSADKRLNHINAIVGNTLISNFCTKVNLFTSLEQSGSIPDYIPATRVIGINNLDDILTSDDTVHIWKPNAGFAGSGIRVLSDRESREKLVSDIRSGNMFRSDEKFWKSRIDQSKLGVLCDYISRPLLFRGHKFHLRLYYLVFVTNNVVYFYLYRNGKIISAEAPYVSADWQNARIHDTHSATGRVDLYPDDIAKTFQMTGVNVIERIKKMFVDLSQRLSTVPNIVDIYPNNKHAFYIYCPDVLIREDGAPFLLEINDKCGYGANMPNSSEQIRTSAYIHLFRELITPILLGKEIKPRDTEYAEFLHVSQLNKNSQQLPSHGGSSDLRVLVLSKNILDEQAVTHAVNSVFRNTYIEVFDTRNRTKMQVPKYREYDFVIMDAGVFAKYSNIRAKITNTLETTQLTDKVNLLRNLGEYDRAPSYIAPSGIVDASNDVRIVVQKLQSIGVRFPLIWKPSDGYSGRGILVLVDESDVDKLSATLSAAPTQGILCKYITNPMLYRGRKFHIRIFIVMARTATGQTIMERIKHGYIIPAELPYTESDYTNPRIHDTHGTYVMEQMFPSADFSADTNDALSRRIDNILSEVVGKLADKCTTYKGNDAGIVVMGADILPDASGNVYLLEINSKVGMKFDNDISKTMSYNEIYGTLASIAAKLIKTQ